MASQVLSGSGNVSYTNNTGQNVRVIINYLNNSGGGLTISWAGVSAQLSQSTLSLGRNLAFINASQTSTSSVSANNMAGAGNFWYGLPTEIMLAPGQTFSATNNITAYNIVVIPEAG